MIGTMEKNMAIPFIVLLSFVCYLPTSAVTIKNEAKNRCEEKNLLTIKTECMSCTLNAAVNCSEGYKKASQGSGQRDCRYFLEIRSYSLSLPGCRHLCTKVETQPKCCSGYWGPECMECPGGASSPCNNRGICADGMGGNGTCICQEKFGGTNCEKCADDDTYGPDCRSVCDCVHGICNSGINGDGKCSCFSGYNGPKCDQPLPDCAVLNCKGNKRCTMSSSGALECKCLPNYEEKGSTCEPINPCLKKVCDAAAYCTYVGPNKHTCTCKEGYRGDGNVCLPIDPCQENFGDCPTASSICKYDGPGQSHCECKEGYNNFQLGIGCNLTDVCATKNTCSKNANCSTISPGQIECTCKKGYVGDGLICYGNILERMKEINKEPGQWQGKLSAAITLFDAYSWQLSSLGPFTVLVPINKGIKARDIKNLIANKENMLYFIKLHMIAGQLNAEDFNTTDLIYTLTGKSGEVSAGEADNELKIRIRGSKKRGTFLAKNLIASNGIIHIIDRAMDFVEPTLESNTKETIMEILLENGRYNRFRSLLEKSNLGPDLEKDGPYTVFVPNNDALSGMENGTLEYLLSREGSWKLLELMRYHIVSSAELDVANIISSSQIMSMANQMIQFNTTSNGQILVNGEEVEEADVAAKNGRIYTLDGVLIPPSILPILPHRCDENTYKIILGTCISCSLVLLSKCPEGSTTTSLFTHKCFYRNSIMGSDYPRIGCSRYCNATVPVPKCCKGFFGTECKPCPGGFTNSCFGNGECMDGMTGSGICVCDEAFTGPDCRRCKDSNMYGPRCDTKCNCLHGRCNNHIDSDGSCLTASCSNGYTGRFCDMKTTPCGPLVTYCHAHAECEYSKKTPNCVCKPGYEGDGFHCKETNPCLNSEKRLCSVIAECIPLGSGAHKCVCRTGWTGDGLDCSEINNCLLENKGGCHVNATCVYIGPGQSDCECNKGFRGDGIQCEAVNTCLEEKDKCHALATCKKAISGFWECVCNEGYQGDGKICYGNVADVIASLPEGSEFHKWTEDPAIRSLISSSSNVTVFVPSQKAFESMSEQDKSYWMRKDKMPILLKYHILPDVFRSDDIKNLSSSDMLATALKNNFLKLSKDNGTVTVGGAKIIAGDIAAVNGVVHLVDKVLTPEPLLAGVMPDLMTRLDQMPDYSIFRGYIIEYKLATVIEESETYTVFAPHNDAITTYIRNKGQATLDENTMRYHIILGQQLMKNDMHEGMHRETLLGFSYQIGFFMRNGELVVNDAPLNYTNAATDKGVIQGIGKVLEIQKNRCDNNDTAVSLSKCGDCLSVLSICESNAKPVPSVRKPCVYSKYSLRKKFLFIGCQTLCVKTVITKECCSGFYGQQCLSCPGKAGNPCFGNGVCLDGFNGTGVCRCEEGFTGTACESCVVGKYGPRCDQACACVNGKCSEGITGDGSCACNVGWRGVKCDTAITEDKCNKACHTSANCLEKAGGTAYCQCASGFQGNGTMCTVIDACATSNGGCSAFAECRKTTPGDRNCVCKQGYTGDGIVCLEIDPCVLNNGGCDQNAECTKTGPNQSVCNCLQGYNGDGQKCKPINPCLTKNGGCSEYATCNHTGPAERTCTCKSSYIGDGIICKGNIYEELRKNTNTSNFFYLLQANVLNELSTTGPFTVFVPTNDALKNDPRTNEWTSKGMMEQVLLYHILSCAQLTKEDLSTMTSFTSLQGEKVTVASSQNTLVLNGDAKLASEEMIVLNNGVVHLIDKVLAPKKMQQRPTTTYDILKNVAESNGYNTIFKLLQDAELMKLIDDPVHRPVTLFLPTDEAIRDLPQEQRDFLFNNQNKDKLIQNLKYHIVRDAGVTANDLIIRGSIKTLQGSDLSVKCGDKDSTTGDIFMDNRQCKIIQRQLLFDGGIAYGIDCLLTPISLGGRCDSLVTMDMSGECGMCFNVPKCPSGSKPKGQKTKCQYELSSRRSIQGCRQECSMVLWMAKCCKGYYGRDCQACPGSPEIPCNKHGTCDEGYTGTGECRCSPEFNGTACELCMPGRYGPDCKLCDCTENGQCDEGITGNGECSCKRGWIGKRCETKLDLPPVCTPPCNRDAVCKRDKTCECKKFYEGDGRTCKVINLCQANNGGCDKNAKCSQSGVKVTCSCLKGYSGDGTVCTPINPCADGLNGGCHEHAICTMTGPDKRKCECKDQYIGDGISCDLKEAAIDRCMQDNGQCHTDALCADLHYLDTKVGVFHLRSPKGTYKYTYSEATQACKDEDGTLATYKQLAYAQQANYHYCAAGWLAEARVGYPTAFPNPNCGSGYVGIVDYGVRTNMSETWDVFCYRYKDVQCTCKPGYVGDGYQCNGNLLQMLMSFPEFSNFLLEIFKYSNSSVKGKEFVSYLSDLSIQATLFAPSNDGLNENMTLSGRDIEYHIANVSTVFFVDLSNGTSLQTRLGDKLLILFGDTSSDTQTKDQTRYVGGKCIVQWDYIASNGIIHTISEPLKAPPTPIALHAGHGAGIFFGIVFIVGLLALAIYAYKKKFNRKDFQFQQFHEDEDKPSVSVSEFDTEPSSNIANPMYESATTATTPAEPTSDSVYHPFSDSDDQQLVSFSGRTK